MASEAALKWVCSQNESLAPDSERADAYDAGAAAVMEKLERVCEEVCGAHLRLYPNGECYCNAHEILRRMREPS